MSKIAPQGSPRLEALLFAADAKIDEHGAASLTRLCDRVFVPHGAKETGKLWLFVRLAGLPDGRTQIGVKIAGPDGRLIAELKKTDKASAAPYAVQFVAPFSMPISGEGAYRFEVTRFGLPVGSADLIVEFIH